MTKIMSLAVVGALAVASIGAAQAADIRGRIEKVDVENNVIHLTNGIELHYDDEVNEADLTPGSSLRARYESRRGLFEVSSLKITSKK